MGEEPERNWSARGWFLAGLGLFLILFMGAIAWTLWPTLAAPGVEREGSTFTGTAAQAQFILGLFGLVIGFGAVSILNGGYMIATGRRSRVLTAILITLFAILFAIGWAIRKKWIF